MAGDAGSRHEYLSRAERAVCLRASRPRRLDRIAPATFLGDRLGHSDARREEGASRPEPRPARCRLSDHAPVAQLDDKEIQLKRQNKIFFQISGAGHEAVLTAAGMVLRPAYDWFFPYYRDRALCLALGMTPAEMLYEAVGRRGRSELRRPPDAESLGTQGAQHRLVVVADGNPVPAGGRRGRSDASREAARHHRTGFQDDEVVYVSTGDGTTSEGEFWESLNTAANLKLPVVYLVEDNGYAISVPVEVNTAGGSISKLVSSFPDLFIQEVDGCDFLASYEAMSKAVDYARARKGPALVHAHVIRPYSHSLSDDEMLYRPPTERDADAARDPVTVFPRWLVEQGHATDERHRGDSGRGRRGRARRDGRRARRSRSRARRRSTSASTRPTSIRRASSSTPRTIRSSRATRPRWSICSTRA